MTSVSSRKTRRVGRRSRGLGTEATTPGKILLLATLSALPILFLFVVAPLARPSALPIQEYPIWRWLFLAGTPLGAAWALSLFYRAPAWARAHNAAKAGRMLSFANAALWAAYGSLYVWLFVLNSPPAA